MFSGWLDSASKCSTAFIVLSFTATPIPILFARKCRQTDSRDDYFVILLFVNPALIITITGFG